MDTNKIDPQLISENLTELLTNSINISSLFAKVFYDTIPSDAITLSQYVVKDDGSLDIQNVDIKNVAQIEQELIGAIGDEVAQNVGSIMDDNTIKLNSENKYGVNSILPSVTAGTATIAETLKNTLGGLGIKVWVGTQEDYDFITKDPDTLYFIKES